MHIAWKTCNGGSRGPQQRWSALLAIRFMLSLKFMRKAKSKSDELRAAHKRSDFKKLERGKYYERIKASSNVVVLDPEVLDVFPNSATVNRTLRALAPVFRLQHRSASKRKSA